VLLDLMPPGQLQSLAGQEHGRTIPLADFREHIMWRATQDLFGSRAFAEYITVHSRRRSINFHRPVGRTYSFPSTGTKGLEAAHHSIPWRA
jgi:hypothetical protein